MAWTCLALVFSSTYKGASQRRGNWIKEQAERAKQSEGPSRCKGSSPEMDLVVGGGRTMAQSQEGGDTRQGTQTGGQFRERPAMESEESQASQADPGKPQVFPLHGGFVGGCLGFSSGTSDTYISPGWPLPERPETAQCLPSPCPEWVAQVPLVLANTLEGGAGLALGHQ